MKGKRKSASGDDKGDEPETKKFKMDATTKEKLKKQTKKIYYYRDMLQRNCGKKDLEELLSHNDQEVPVGVDRMLDRLADIMMFGALEKCGVCSDGQFVFRHGQF